MTRAAPASGKQLRLALADTSAVLTEGGAGLRSCCANGEDPLDGYDVGW